MKKTVAFTLSSIVVFLAANGVAEPITKLHTFFPNMPVKASEMNDSFDHVIAGVNSVDATVSTLESAGYLTSESDPQVGSNTSGYVSKYDGSALVSGTIYDNGNVGIGTNSPTYKLDLLTDSNKIVSRFSGTNEQGTIINIANSNSATQWNIAAGGSSGWANNSFVIDNNAAEPRFVIVPGGNIGIGITTPAEKVEVNGNVKAMVFMGDKLHVGNKLYAGAAQWPIEGGGVNHVALDTFGGMFIRGHSVITHNLTVGGWAKDSYGYALYVNGNIHATGTNTASDARLKENIQPLDSSLEKISKIRGVSYEWRAKEKTDDRTHLGVIAQEVEEVFPNVVHTVDDEMGTKTVDYNGLIAPLIEAVKTLKAQNEALKTLACQEHPEAVLCSP